MESSAPARRAACAAADQRRWRALALPCGAFLVVLLDGAITIVALPSIRAGLCFPSKANVAPVAAAVRGADLTRPAGEEVS
jgi:hypothetical protein